MNSKKTRVLNRYSATLTNREKKKTKTNSHAVLNNRTESNLLLKLIKI